MSDAGDQRPRPAYGEYATPEEQRARIRHPDASSALEAGQAPGSPVPPAVAPRTAPPTSPPLWGSSSQPVAPGVRAPNPADRIATIALLAFGAFNVVSSAFSYVNLAAAMTSVYQVLGITGTFTNDAAARVWGPIAAGVLVVGYLVTLLLSLRRLRTARITWWLPLVGAAITMLVVSVCLAVPLFGDPAFLEYVRSRS